MYVHVNAKGGLDVDRFYPATSPGSTADNHILANRHQIKQLVAKKSAKKCGQFLSKMPQATSNRGVWALVHPELGQKPG